MTVKLIVLNIPQGVSQDEFRSKFMELRGFQDSKLLLNNSNELFFLLSYLPDFIRYGIVEFATYELADYARKIMSNFTFPNSVHPINIDFYKPQESFDYYPSNMGMNQGMNISSHSMSNISGGQPLQGSHMNFQPNSSGFHYQNPNMSQNVEIEKGSQSTYIPHSSQQSQQFPIENIGHTTGPYSIQSQGQMSQNSIGNMPIYQNTNQNQMINPNIQPSMGMHTMNPNSNQMTHNPNQMISPNTLQTMSTQPSMSTSHNVQMNPNLQMNTSNLSNPNINPNISETMGMNPSPNMRNFQQSNPLMYFGGVQQQPQLSPSTPLNTNFSNMMGGMQNPQFNQMQPNFPQSNISSQQNSFPSKGLGPDDLLMFKVPQNATNSIYVDGIPIDANEREVAHVFRPFPGFQEVRLIKKEAKNGRQFYFCFVDFENSLQSTIALQTLQGYRFDKNDGKGLKISYAFHAPDTLKKVPVISSQTQNKKFKINKKK